MSPTSLGCLRKLACVRLVQQRKGIGHGWWNKFVWKEWFFDVFLFFNVYIWVKLWRVPFAKQDFQGFGRCWDRNCSRGLCRNWLSLHQTCSQQSIHCTRFLCPYNLCTIQYCSPILLLYSTTLEYTTVQYYYTSYYTVPVVPCAVAEVSKIENL